MPTRHLKNRRWPEVAPLKKFTAACGIRCERGATLGLAHYHAERNHQVKDNVLLLPTATKAIDHGGSSVNCKQRLGGLLKYYHLEAA